MSIKKLLIPAALLFTLTALSHAQQGSISYGAGAPVSYQHDDVMALICPLNEGNIEIFKVAEKYMNTEKSELVQKCCRYHKDSCKIHRTVDGNSLAHLAAYAGDTKLLEKLIKEEGFPQEHWQLVKGSGIVRIRTQLMYAAEQGRLKTVKMLVLDLRVNCATKNEDGKTAQMLAKEAGKTDVVNFLKANCGGDYIGQANTANKQSVVFAAQDIQAGKTPPPDTKPYKI